MPKKRSFLTFFTQISGRNFLSTEQSRAIFEARKGRKGAEKGRGRGVTTKGGKKEKRTRENRSILLMVGVLPK